MNVYPIAWTRFHPEMVRQTGYIPHGFWADNTETPYQGDELAEFAGRNCYQAWERKRPSTATNSGYLANIINQGHESVLEHASVTFFAEGVSRSLTHELIRHRHLSFSELSQRYVNMEDAKFTVPPAFAESAVRNSEESLSPDEIDRRMQTFPIYQDIKAAYGINVEELEADGYTHKQAREAARSLLPNSMETKIVVTGNIRAWRDMLKKRHSVHADREMQGFAAEILRNLREIVPASVQDIPDDPYGKFPVTTNEVSNVAAA